MEDNLDRSAPAGPPRRSVLSLVVATTGAALAVGGSVTLARTDLVSNLWQNEKNADDAQQWLREELEEIQKSATADDRNNDGGFWLVDHLLAFLQGKDHNGQTPFIGSMELPSSGARVGVNHGVILAASAAWSVLDINFGSHAVSQPGGMDMETRNRIREAFARYIARLDIQTRNGVYPDTWQNRAQHLILKAFSLYLDTHVNPAVGETAPHLPTDTTKTVAENIDAGLKYLTTPYQPGDGFWDAAQYVKAVVGANEDCSTVRCTDDVLEKIRRDIETAFPGQAPAITGMSLRQALLTLRDFLLATDGTNHLNARERFKVEGDSPFSSPLQALATINLLLTVHPRANKLHEQPSPSARRDLSGQLVSGSGRQPG